MLSIVFIGLLIGGWNLVSAAYSCSEDSDCKVHVCSNVCVNNSFGVPQNCTQDTCPQVTCAIPVPLNMRPSACKCENNICVNDSENNIAGCNSLYWIDNDNKECGQKQFCGVYVYYGLQTFESKTQCENALGINKTKACPENSEDENGKCMFTLSNGRKAEIKIMPETASERAIARLGELGFTIKLKEVGKGEDIQLVYELTGNKQGKFLGIFKIIARVQAQVDAEDGNVKVIKPWWSFLASGI